MSRRRDLEVSVFADRLGFQLRRVNVLMMQALDAALQGHGLTPARATALVHIGLDEGCDQTALGRALDINPASTMDMVNALVALGAVVRRRGSDRRSNSLFLTEEGRQLRDEVERVVEQHDNDFFSSLTARERATLDTALRNLRREHGPADSLLPQDAPRLRRIK